MKCTEEHWGFWVKIFVGCSYFQRHPGEQQVSLRTSQTIDFTSAFILTKGHQIRRFSSIYQNFLAANIIWRREIEMRKIYFVKLVTHLKNVYHVERSLNKFSDGSVNPTYSAVMAVLFVVRYA